MAKKKAKESNDQIFDADCIEKERINKSTGKLEFYVKWKGWKDRTWEPEENLIEPSLVQEWNLKKTRGFGRTKETARMSTGGKIHRPDQATIAKANKIAKANTSKALKATTSPAKRAPPVKRASPAKRAPAKVKPQAGVTKTRNALKSSSVGSRVDLQNGTLTISLTINGKSKTFTQKFNPNFFR